MKILLNEQEIVDGICVWMAREFGGEPFHVNVIGLDLHRNGEVTAIAEIFDNREELDQEDIEDGIALFFEEYHEFDPNVMEVNVFGDGMLGFTAEVLINEG